MTEPNLNLNKPLLTQTMNAIIRNPEHWNQSSWHCGTSHCFAGFAEVIDTGCKVTEGWDREDTYTPIKAKESLGLTDHQAGWLFDSDRTLEELYTGVQYLLKEGLLLSEILENAYREVEIELLPEIQGE